MFNPSDIFNDSIPFERKALQAFHYQMKHNKTYSDFVHTLNINPQNITAIEEIPFLPIEIFKTEKILAAESYDTVFTSSGTTGNSSKHYIYDINLYIESFTKGFEHFYGNPQNFCLLALLPSYLEREGSSLVFMCEHLIRKSDHPLSGFYLNNIEELAMHLQELHKQQHAVMLIGVSYALLDLAAAGPISFSELIVVETGGMKGRRKEMIREELHKELKSAFSVDVIHSEYGMTELLSQAWSGGNGRFKCPPWMKVLVRDVNDPFCFPGDDYTGGLNIIDLANIYSCPFIATQDLGRTGNDHTFEVLGRFDHSDLRGCNLMTH